MNDNAKSSLNVRLPSQMIVTLQHAAFVLQVSTSYLADEAIREYIERNAEKFKELGIDQPGIYEMTDPDRRAGIKVRNTIAALPLMDRVLSIANRFIGGPDAFAKAFNGLTPEQINECMKGKR